MARRDQRRIADVKIRMREPLRSRVEKAAKARGVSMNAEMVDRLEQSFAADDTFAGPMMRQIAQLMAAAFYHAGHAASEGKDPAEWIRDPVVYARAVFAVNHALRAGTAPATPSAGEIDRHMALFARAKLIEMFRHRYARETDPTARVRIENEIRRLEMGDVDQDAWRRAEMDRVMKEQES